MSAKKITARRVLPVLATLMLLVPAIGLCGQGQEAFDLDGGKFGKVHFKHHLHQSVAGDCMVCHKDFAKAPGALNQAKASGKLQKKQVMNKTCIQCHRDRKKAGDAHGPTSCNACHQK